MSTGEFEPSSEDKETMEGVRDRLEMFASLVQTAAPGTVLRSIPGVTVTFIEMAGMLVASVFEAETERPLGTITPEGDIVYVQSKT